MTYDTVSHDCSRILHRYKAAEEESLLQRNNRCFFNYVSKCLQPKSFGIVLNDGNTSLSSTGDIAQYFAKKFSKNFSTDINCKGNASAEYFGPRLKLINVEVNAMRKLLMEHRNSAVGPDGIPGIFYKKLACVLVILLSIIFQQSVQHRKIPVMWRQANVMPLYKGKGPKSCASSYHHVGLTDMACKLLERRICQIKSGISWLQTSCCAMSNTAFFRGGQQLPI